MASEKGNRREHPTGSPRPTHLYLWRPRRHRHDGDAGCRSLYVFAMNKDNVRLRSFTVPRGSRFVCVPPDGSGPIIVEEGCQVSIRVDESYEVAIEAARALFETKPEVHK